MAGGFGSAARRATTGRAMTRPRIFGTSFSAVYPLYVQKVERKGRTRAEVDQVICWLTGYGPEGLAHQLAQGSDVETFFAQAPRLHPNVALLRGVVCGVRVEAVDDPLMQKIRWLDELVKGKLLDKVLR